MGMGEMAGADARSSSLLGQKLQAERWKSDQMMKDSLRKFQQNLQPMPGLKLGSQDKSDLSTNARKQLASAEPVLELPQADAPRGSVDIQA